MGIRAPLIMSGLIIAWMVSVSVLAWPHIPDGMKIATHFDIYGNPNRFSGKTGALIISPLIACVVTLWFVFLPKLRPSLGNIQTASSPAFHIVWMGILLVIALGHTLIVMRARGILIDITGNMTFFVALFVIVVGNFLGKTEPNNFFGVRTYWALSSDYAWEKSNRATGHMFVAAGLIGLGAITITDKKTAREIFIVCILLASLIGVFLSYYYWRTDPDRIKS